MSRTTPWSRVAFVELAIVLALLLYAFASAKTARIVSPTTDITRVPYAASLSCRPDGCTVMTGLIEVGTRVLRADDGAGCVLRTVTLADAAPLPAPIVEAVHTAAPDGSMVARVRGFAQLPMPRVHSVDVPTPCPIADSP